jgi:WS/DGAT/MGAT family acyltransferase
MPGRMRDDEEETMAGRQRMSPVDTAWLRMDSPANLMMIVGIDVFADRVDCERLKQVLESRFLTYDRFRCRVAQDATGYWWEEDKDFDLDHHLIRVELPAPGGKAELQRFAAQLASQALDPGRPLWQMHLVEHYEGGSALVIRIHHCIADGMALMGVLLSMTSTSADSDDRAEAPPARPDRRVHDGTWEALLRPFTDATVKAIDATGDIATRVLHAYGAVLEDPNLAGEAAAEYARSAARAAQDAAALVLMDGDSATSLKGRTTGSKVVAWNEPLRLADVKAVGHALGCSVNDVLLACAAGAFREYFIARGEDVTGCEIRAMVPVNLRPPGPPKTLGNKFGLVPLLLPVGIESPIARVLEVHARMEELKGGYMPVLAMAILGMTGLVPRAAQNQILEIFQRKATAVMTNVPGPQQTLYLAGAQLKQMMFWVPQSGNVGVGVSILSYDGGVQFGLVTDKKLCADPQDIIDRFAPEFEKLVYALLLLPWEEYVAPEMAERALFSTESVAGVAARLIENHAERGPAEPPGLDPGPPGCASADRPLPLRARRNTEPAGAGASAVSVAPARGAGLGAGGEYRRQDQANSGFSERTFPSTLFVLASGTQTYPMR